VSLSCCEEPIVSIWQCSVDSAGKDFMRGAEQFVSRKKPDLFLPMHFGGIMIKQPLEKMLPV
jgi:hypothetical protein